jgi:two-component system, chemotaxis family, sensor kinase CheA
MDPDALFRRLMVVFLDELEEHAGAIESRLMAIELETSAAVRRQHTAEVLRTAHTLKGAARSIGLEPIESVCHGIEGLLEAAGDRDMPPAPAVMQLLLATIDAMRAAGSALRHDPGDDLSTSSLAGLSGRLETAALEYRTSGTVKTAASDPEAPAPAVSRVTAERSVRLGPERLQLLLERSNELLVARGRVDECHADIAGIADLASACRRQWRSLDRLLRQSRVHMGEGEDGEPWPPDSTGLRPAADAGRVHAVAALLGSSLADLAREAERVTTASDGHLRALHVVAAGLQDEIRHIRMLPFVEACEGLDRLVRDLAQSGGKQVALVIDGKDVEADRDVLGRLRQPLLHLVRNAVDHGIELPEERREAGKTTGGTVRVAASVARSHITVVVSDDGRGIDFHAVRERAAREGLQVPERDHDLIRLLFRTGFTTAPHVTELSGRGLGLDVVRRSVESLHGTVEVSSEHGRGASFTMRMPITTSTMRALLVAAGGQVFALPETGIRKLLRLPPGDIRPVRGRDAILTGDTTLPIASLAGTLGLPVSRVDDRERLTVVVAASGPDEMAFVVDEALELTEVVVSPLGSRLRRQPLFSGATLLPSGRIVLVLRPANLMQAALEGRTPEPIFRQPTGAGAGLRRRVLLVEDSATTRALEKAILDAAGYEVIAATDGLEGWQLLQEHGADLVVADVQMPRMDGFELAETVRGSRRFRDLPIVLVTALESESDRKRGMDAGADAYLVKSGFDQRALLRTIEQLL